VKIRNLLTVVAMLSVLLLSGGSAFAVLGVDDNVPGQDFAFPLICAVPVTGQTNFENTLYAIPEILGTSIDSPDKNGNVVYTHCQIKDIHSNVVQDFDIGWTPYDVVTGDCSSLVAPLSTSQKSALTQTTDGVSYYEGYLECQQITAATGVASVLTNRLLPYVYLVDLPEGFASGFNGPRLEDGSGPFLGEEGDTIEVTANTLFARYYINNTDPRSWDWWMILAGRQQYSTINATSSRVLNGDVCDESEDCVSLALNLPYQLNIIDVASNLPGAPLNTTPPLAGFGYFQIQEKGNNIIVGPFTITGTINDPLVTVVPVYYSIYGWSYERAEAGTAAASWDVIHPMDRIYCSGAYDGASGAGNDAACSFKD